MLKDTKKLVIPGPKRSFLNPMKVLNDTVELVNITTRKYT